MFADQDPEVADIQYQWLVDHRQAQRWMITEDHDGFTVHEHSADGVAPPSTYATKELAAARLLQLLGLQAPITPQTWPESVRVGYIAKEPSA